MAKQKKKATKPDDPSQPVRFEDALRGLEQIVGQLEDGELGLDESLACYEKGVQHLQRCYQLLDQAERKIQLLQGVDADGNPVVESFQDEDATLEEKARSRGTRRSKPVKNGPKSGRSAETNIDDAPGLF